MTLEQALLGAVSALWLVHRWHLKRLAERVDNCESDRTTLRKELDALKAIFLRGSCGIFGCDVRKRMTAEEVQERINEMERMEKGTDHEKDRRK
jgi:hypothetical protein